MVEKTIYASEYPEQFSQLVRRQLSRGENLQDAEDQAQQAYIKGLSAAEKRNFNELNFYFLLTLLKQQWIDDYRTNQDQSVLYEDHEDTRNCSPEVIYLGKEITSTIESNLTKLPPVYRQVVKSRFLDGLSENEIATAIGKSNGSVRVIMHRALKKLREMRW